MIRYLLYLTALLLNLLFATKSLSAETVVMEDAKCNSYDIIYTKEAPIKIIIDKCKSESECLEKSDGKTIAIS